MTTPPNEAGPESRDFERNPPAFHPEPAAFEQEPAARPAAPAQPSSWAFQQPPAPFPAAPGADPHNPPPAEQGPWAFQQAATPCPPPPEAADPAEVLRKKVYIGFAATVAVGLALTGLYIGGRLFAKSSASHATPLAVKAVEQIAPPAVPQSIAQNETPRPSPFGTSPKPALKTEAAVKPAPAPPPASEPQPAAAAAPGQPAWNLATPKPGEKYLQVAALPPGNVGKYLKELEAKGIQPTVAPGPDDNNLRILVGPLADQQALDRQRDALRAAGIDWMLRVY